ncbi:hypothetical protein KTJ89_06640 [Brevibacterium sediminis]|uniref:hypothetical protein n=1 Tax=Brevibacterium sediminis TaxID=1857024 RepID=UPI00217537E5|nr:hypothetical protein [Brevibacterium sediminis]MCS4592662.1 hypothetical protein [Brevibacterium sediminis]
MVTKSELAATEAANDRASDEFDLAHARAGRAQEALGRLQCRFSWRSEVFRPGWPVLWCGRPEGHEGNHDARFYLEEDPSEEFAVAVAEWVSAAGAAEKAAMRLLETWSAVERLERPEVAADIDEACRERELDGILESMEAAERREWEESRFCEVAEVVDEFGQYPLDGFWDPRWGSSLSETEEDENREAACGPVSG